MEIDGLLWLVSLVFDGLIATETADLPYTDTQGSREKRTPRARRFSLYSAFECAAVSLRADSLWGAYISSTKTNYTVLFVYIAFIPSYRCSILLAASDVNNV